MILTTEQYQKIEILDKVLSGITVEDIKDMAGCDLIASKLKDSYGPMLLSQLFSEINTMQGELMSLKSDFGTNLKCLNKGMGDPSFHNLKNKHSFY